MAYDRHILDLTTLEKEYNTDILEGLSSREAKSRLEKERKRGATTSLFVPGNKDRIAKFAVFFCSPFVVLLLIMSLLTALFGRPVLGCSVFAFTFAGEEGGLYFYF